MKSCFRVLLSIFVLWTIPACTGITAQFYTPTMLPREPEIAPKAVTSTAAPRGPEIAGVFEGVTPCSAEARPLPQVPAESDCEQMIWSLVLYQDAKTGAPTTYHLQSAYGLSKPNTNDLIDGGTPIVMEGTWTITTGAKSDPAATVYQIDPDDPQTTVSFLKVNENLLHVLDREQAMLVGNGAWSYTLNRMDDQSPVEEHVSIPPEPPARPPLPPMPEGSSVFAVFDGRTPCHDLVMEFSQNTPYPGCLKIKWRLTLYHDSVTGAPTSYLFMGTSTYREGSWTIVHGIDDDSDAVVYQLQVREAQVPISFLQVDENHLFLMDRERNLLVGNQLFSYTLSRVNTETP